MRQDAERQRRSRREFGSLWSPIFVPLMFIAAAVSVPYAVGRLTYWRSREKRFARKMALAGRTISFDEVAQKIRNGEGTLISEWYSVLKGPVRHWWTRDDVLALSPVPCADRFAMARRRYKSVVEWLFRQYMSPEEGKALFFAVNNEQKKLLARLEEKARAVDVPTFSTKNW